MTIEAQALQELKTLLDRDQVISNATDLITYERDASIESGHADALVLVRSAQDVARVVGWAHRYGVPLVARGAGTSLSGGAVPERGGVVLEFSAMKQVLDLDEAGRSVVVQPGVVNLVLDDVAHTHGLYYPPDPASGRSSTLGGNLAENAGGPHCFKYGVTTNYVTGLRVVLSDGRTIRLGGRALDCPEYDLLGVLVGSEGTLGVITEATLRLVRNPPAVETALVSFDSVEQAGDAVSAIIRRGLVPATMEMMDRKIMGIVEDFIHAGLPVEDAAALIIETDGYADSVMPQLEEITTILGEHGGHDVHVAQNAEERERLWFGRKSAAGAVARLAPAYYTVDTTVPRSKLGEALVAANRLYEDNDLLAGYVFHAGDGNLHPLVLIPDPDDPELMQRVIETGRELGRLSVQMGGSLTGEHGVGIEKREFMPLMFSPDELAVMSELKQLFDPQNILNPGKIFPSTMPAAQAEPAPGAPPAEPVYVPQNAAEAAAALRAWRAAGRRVHITGGEPSPRSGEAVLSTERLRGVLTYAPDDLYVTVGVGTPLDELQAELAQDGMWVPLVSPQKGRSIGSLIATNSNAPLRMRYGGVRDLTLALGVVMPDGRFVRAGRPVVKDVAGYDVQKLFIGSYGTLGLITSATLKLLPLPRARSSLVIPPETLEAGLRLAAPLRRVNLVASGLLLCHNCLLPGSSASDVLIYTAEGVPEDVNAEIEEARGVLRAAGLEQAVTTTSLAASDFWADWLAAEPEALTLRTAVAAKDLPALVTAQQTELEKGAFIADIANGMLYTRGADLDALRPAALGLGGYTLVLAGSAPDPWGYRPESLGLMRALKARWDPQGLLNPGAFIV